MKALKAIYTREMREFFFSPIAYVVLVGFLAVTGFMFYMQLGYYQYVTWSSPSSMPEDFNLHNVVITAMMMTMAIVLMIITPLLTMRLLSEEKRRGTIELLLSYPVSDTTVVAAKFLATWSFFLLMLACTLPMVGIVAYLESVHLPSLLVSYLGLALLGAAFIAMGLFFSAVTENQIVAAVGAFAALIILWSLTSAANMVSSELGWDLARLSLRSRFNAFPQGVLDTADLAFLCIFTALFLFLSIRVLEIRRWRAS